VTAIARINELEEINRRQNGQIRHDEIIRQMSARIDAQSARIDARIDAQSARIGAQSARIDAHINSHMSARLDAQIGKNTKKQAQIPAHTKTKGFWKRLKFWSTTTTSLR
jgi:hypothetical protein